MSDSVSPKVITVETTNLTPTDISKVDPNKLLFDFLQEHNLKLTVTALNEENPFIGDGFVLTDRPLLKIQVIQNK